MWSLYLFVNKILNMEEGEGQGSDEKDSSLNGLCSKLSSINLLNSDVVLPESRFIEVPHINQLYNWDCGLACVLMVLQTIGITKFDSLSMEKLCSSTSVWTVDLAYILQKFSVRFTYFTVTLGANPSFFAERFYQDQLANDLARVNKLFREAWENGISIKCRSISEKDISLAILSGNYIAIALVDQYKLSQWWLKDVCMSSFSRSSLPYTGHYIVICGYDTAKDEFEIRDSASSSKHKRVSSRCLHEARKSFGTDEDLLLISLENRLDEGAFSSANSDNSQ